jgi:hypothetical protein
MTYCIDAGNASYSSGDMVKVISPGSRSTPPLLRRPLTMLRRNVFLVVDEVLLLLVALVLLVLLMMLLLLAFAVWWEDVVGKHSGRRVAGDAERLSVLDLGDDPALWNRRPTSHEPAMQAATLPNSTLPCVAEGRALELARCSQLPLCDSDLQEVILEARAGMMVAKGVEIWGLDGLECRDFVYGWIVDVSVRAENRRAGDR